MDERKSIQQLKQGQIQGLEWLVAQHQVKAVRAAFLITHDLATAEDVVQEAFLNAFRYIRSFDESRLFEPWFLRSVINLAVAATRNRSQAGRIQSEEDPVDFEELLAAEEGSPEQQLEAAEFQESVWRAIQRLSPRQRAVVVQRYYLGMSEKEMAEALGTASGTVKWLLNAARDRLRNVLGSERNTQ